VFQDETLNLAEYILFLKFIFIKNDFKKAIYWHNYKYYQKKFIKYFIQKLLFMIFLRKILQINDNLHVYFHNELYTLYLHLNKL